MITLIVTRLLTNVVVWYSSVTWYAAFVIQQFLLPPWYAVYRLAGTFPELRGGNKHIETAKDTKDTWAEWQQPNNTGDGGLMEDGGGGGGWARLKQDKKKRQTAKQAQIAAVVATHMSATIKSNLTFVNSISLYWNQRLNETQCTVKIFSNWFHLICLWRGAICVAFKIYIFFVYTCVTIQGIIYPACYF